MDPSEQVPVMDDFERTRRFYTTQDLSSFVNQSLWNYYQMFVKEADEFQYYKMNNQVEMFTIYINETANTNIDPSNPIFN